MYFSLEIWHFMILWYFGLLLWSKVIEEKFQGYYWVTTKNIIRLIRAFKDGKKNWDPEVIGKCSNSSYCPIERKIMFVLRVKTNNFESKSWWVMLTCLKFLYFSKKILHYALLCFQWCKFNQIHKIFELIIRYSFGNLSISTKLPAHACFLLQTPNWNF